MGAPPGSDSVSTTADPRPVTKYDACIVPLSLRAPVHSNGPSHSPASAFNFSMAAPAGVESGASAAKANDGGEQSDDDGGANGASHVTTCLSRFGLSVTKPGGARAYFETRLKRSVSPDCALRRRMAPGSTSKLHLPVAPRIARAHVVCPIVSP